MTGPFEDVGELRTLLDALCEETITAEQMQTLEKLVLTHPEAEAYYVQYMSLFADLGRHFQRDKQNAKPEEVKSEGPRHKETTSIGRRRFSTTSRRLMSLVAVAAGLLLVFALGQRWQKIPRLEEHLSETTDDSVAVLLQAPGAKWESANPRLRAGAALSPGWLHLASGFAQIEFYSGATVILEAPADFQLISAKEAYCALGKLRATVPPQAQGFTIGSPKLELVDLGTEFGLQVGAGDRTEVHVFQGKVEVHDAGSHGVASTNQELTTGQAVRVDGPGKVSRIQSDPAAFHTAEDVAARSEAEIQRLQRNWLEASRAVRQDPALLVYYPFEAEHSWSRNLLNQADAARLHPQDGVMVGCTWVTGRWPVKQGLEFKRVSDRVRFLVPGEYESLTLAAWVRVDALPNRFNSLMMTDGWSPGAPHWHIHNDGVIELGVQGRSGQRAHYETPELFLPEQLGRWKHLAVVYDREGGVVTHYIDGQPVSQDAIQFHIPLQLGDTQLGNWNSGKHRPWEKNPLRNFTGCMDEFMLFARALSDQEIERFYTQGRPPL